MQEKDEKLGNVSFLSTQGWPGYARFSDQKSSFLLGFQKKKKKKKKSSRAPPKIKIFPLQTSPQSGFLGKTNEIASGIPDFAFEALTSCMGGREGAIYLE